MKQEQADKAVWEMLAKSQRLPLERPATDPALDAAEPGAAFEDISVTRPLTPQDCERAMRILMNPPLRLPEEVHRVGCAKFKRRACDCGAAPQEQIFDEELKRMKAAKGKR